jgi:hypothetical protein
MKAGRKWIDQTTNACTIVVVLIATVAFTCAYTTSVATQKQANHCSSTKLHFALSQPRTHYCSTFP